MSSRTSLRTSSLSGASHESGRSGKVEEVEEVGKRAARPWGAGRGARLDCLRAGDAGKARAGRRRGAELVDVLRRVLQSALQSAEADRSHQREEPGDEVDSSQPGVRCVAVVAAGG